MKTMQKHFLKKGNIRSDAFLCTQLFHYILFRTYLFELKEFESAKISFDDALKAVDIDNAQFSNEKSKKRMINSINSWQTKTLKKLNR
jgi:hypothetical protein